MNRFIVPENIHNDNSNDLGLFNTSEDDYNSSTATTATDASVSVSGTGNPKMFSSLKPIINDENIDLHQTNELDHISTHRFAPTKTKALDHLFSGNKDDLADEDADKYIIAQSTLPRIESPNSDAERNEAPLQENELYNHVDNQIFDSAIFDPNNSHHILNQEPLDDSSPKRNFSSTLNLKTMETLQKDLTQSQLQVKLLTHALKQEKIQQQTNGDLNTSKQEHNLQNIEYDRKIEALRQEYEAKISQLETKVSECNKDYEVLEGEYQTLLNDEIPPIMDALEVYHDNMNQLFDFLNGYVENNKEFLTMKKNHKHLKVDQDINKNFQQIVEFFNENLTTIKDYKIEQQQLREEILHDVSSSDDDDNDDQINEQVENLEQSDETQNNTINHINLEQLQQSENDDDIQMNTKLEMDIEQIHSQYQEFFEYIMKMLEESERYEYELEGKIEQQNAALHQLEAVVSQELQHQKSVVENNFLTENSKLLTDINDLNKYLKHQDLHFNNFKSKNYDFQDFLGKYCVEILNLFEQVFEPTSINSARAKLNTHINFNHNTNKTSFDNIVSVLDFLKKGTQSLIAEYIQELKLKNKNINYIETKELKKKWLLEKHRREVDLKAFEEKLANLRV